MMKTFVAVFAIVTLATGCQSVPSAPSASHYSGFLDNYAQLQPASDREGVSLYVDRSTDYRPFIKLMFEPVQVLVTPGPGQQQLPPEVRDRMSKNFRESLRRAFEPDYQLVSTPGPDVLRVRSAITGLQTRAKPSDGLTDYIPVKTIYNMDHEPGKTPALVKMQAEIEVLQPSSKRAFAATTTRNGSQTLKQDEQVTWASLQPISEYWARNFRDRLYQLRGVSPTTRR